MNLRPFEEIFSDLLKICDNASSTNINEVNGNSIASANPVIDVSNVSNLKGTEQRPAAVQNNDELDADYSSLVHVSIVNTPDICNSPTDDDSRKHELSEDCAQKNTPRQENVAQETSQPRENIDENLSKSEDTPRQRKGAQETVQIVENLDATVPFKLRDTPPDGYVIQGTIEDVEDALLEVEDTPQEREGAQGATGTLGEVETNIKSELELENTSEVIDETIPPKLGDSPQKRKTAPTTASTLEEDDANFGLELEGTPQEWKLMQMVPSVYEAGVTANALLDSEENLSERKEEETTIKCVEDYETDVHLVVEEASASSLDDDETATTTNCLLKSSSIEIAEATYSEESARQLLFEWLSGYVRLLERV